MNWPKITGYVGVTVISISVLAEYCASIVPEPHIHAEAADVLRWAQYIGAYLVVVTGIYFIRVLKKPKEFWASILMAALSLLPLFGFLIIIGYFFWAFAKLDNEDGGLPF